MNHFFILFTILSLIAVQTISAQTKSASSSETRTGRVVPYETKAHQMRKLEQSAGVKKELPNKPLGKVFSKLFDGSIFGGKNDAPVKSDAAASTTLQENNIPSQVTDEAAKIETPPSAMMEENNHAQTEAIKSNPSPLHNQAKQYRRLYYKRSETEPANTANASSSANMDQSEKKGFFSKIFDGKPASKSTEMPFVTKQHIHQQYK